jgi:energy-coupling factor transporter ATP-binding protein EcfA2
MSTPLLEVEDVGRQFVARRSVLGRPTAIVAAVDGVSFSLEVGKTLALVGESGCGKSTLGRLVLRLIEPTAGRIRFDGRDVTALRERELRPLRRNAQLIADPEVRPGLCAVLRAGRADEPNSQRGDCSALPLRQPPPASPTHANIPRRLQTSPSVSSLGTPDAMARYVVAPSSPRPAPEGLG